MKSLVFSSLFFIVFQAHASFGDWIEKAANKAIGLDTSTVTLSNVEYSNADPIVAFGYKDDLTQVSGRALNTSHRETVKTIVFKYEILECNNSGQNCTTIGESEKRWNTNIPPRQVRYFDHTISYTSGHSSKKIYFRQYIKYVYPYSDI